MQLTVEQILTLAPDAGAQAAGRKLGTAKPWKNPGQTDTAVWGECQGSALYQVRVDLASFGYHCSCPSRKLPCKHVLGLLLLTAGAPAAVPQAEPPEWVADWLAKRATRAQKREEKKEKAAEPADPAAQTKRAEQRHQRVLEGLDRFDLWLNDLVRNGLAGLELQPACFWENQAKRLVDAQAPGLATRLRRLSEIPGSTPDWPRRLLGHLGRLALLTHAYRRLEQLSEPLQTDVRQLIGWTVNQDDLAAQGETVSGRWLVLGQTVGDEDRLRVQRSWLVEEGSGRTALVLQFSAAGQPFPEMVVPGMWQEADLVFWPSAYPQRARFATRRGECQTIAGALPGVPAVSDFLRQFAAALAWQPWLDRFLCVLKNVTPIPRCNAPWQIRDAAGEALPLAGPEHWKLLALSGGRPVDLAGEWNGEQLWPLGVAAEGAYHLLGNNA
jgi:hypothetical protein